MQTMESLLNVEEIHHIVLVYLPVMVVLDLDVITINVGHIVGLEINKVVNGVIPVNTITNTGPDAVMMTNVVQHTDVAELAPYKILNLV